MSEDHPLNEIFFKRVVISEMQITRQPQPIQDDAELTQDDPVEIDSIAKRYIDILKKLRDPAIDLSF